MTFEEFRESISEPLPPQLSLPLLALWHDARNEWNAAHEAAQADGSANHAYLHRKEGDISNAGYWYRRAGKATAIGSLEEEWEVIARSLLEG